MVCGTGKSPLAKQVSKYSGKGQKRQKNQNWLCISYLVRKNDTLLEPCFYKSSCSVRNSAFFGWRLIPKCFTEINYKVKLRNWVESMGNHVLCMFAPWVLQRGEKHFRKGDAVFFQQLEGGVSWWYYHRWYSQFMDFQMKIMGTVLSKIPLYFFW